MTLKTDIVKFLQIGDFMKAVILAGGLGTRISEETHVKPKPMVELCGKPILAHLMEYLFSQGINEFVICLGYKGYVIKEFFSNYFMHSSNMEIDFSKINETGEPEVNFENHSALPWKITLVETGELTPIGGRLRRIADYVKGDSSFLMTYGDGLANVDITALREHHQREKKLVTVTGVRPPGRFGVLEIDGNTVTSFSEKTDNDEVWINGGFFMINPKALSWIENDNVAWEEEPLESIAAARELSVYKHSGFWQAMDTLRDKRKLESLLLQRTAPWVVSR